MRELRAECEILYDYYEEKDNDADDGDCGDEDVDENDHTVEGGYLGEDMPQDNNEDENEGENENKDLE